MTQTTSMPRVIAAASLGTAFEFYDFLLYGSLAAILGGLFFPPGNDTSALLGSLATFGAGFLMRPIGALIFGRLGDRVGRKRTFLVTIVLMGLSTALVGALPTYASIGWWAPVLLVALRMLQGLALGGEFGGAALYISEHCPENSRGRHTAWIQTAGTMGLILSLIVVIICRGAMGEDDFRDWGWRVPFLASVVLLGLSVYVRARLRESPLFEEIRARGELSESPIVESFFQRDNARRFAAALIGGAPFALTWYTAQFYSLVFLQGPLQLDVATASLVIIIALACGIPLFLAAGALSDRVGRKPVILAGMLVSALLYIPGFGALVKVGNPAAAQATESAPITVYAAPARFKPFAEARDLDDGTRVRDLLAKRGFSYSNAASLDAATPVAVRIGDELLRGFDRDAVLAALKRAGYPEGPGVRLVRSPLDIEARHLMLAGIILAMVAGAALTGGAAAAWLSELFPTRIRYTSLSVPYHLTSAWFGGFMPLTASWLVARSGNILNGLWYSVAVCSVCFVLGLLLMPETRGRRMQRPDPSVMHAVDRPRADRAMRLP